LLEFSCTVFGSVGVFGFCGDLLISHVAGVLSLFDAHLHFRLGENSDGQRFSPD